jgi:hypothetical protein
MNMEGKDNDAVTTPRRNGEPVISSTNQARAKTRILLPMSELMCPAIRRAKSLLLRGLRNERKEFLVLSVAIISCF